MVQEPRVSLALTFGDNLKMLNAQGGTSRGCGLDGERRQSFVSLYLETQLYIDAVVRKAQSTSAVRLCQNGSHSGWKERSGVKCFCRISQPHRARILRPRCESVCLGKQSPRQSAATCFATTPANVHSWLTLAHCFIRGGSSVSLPVSPR